MWLSGGTGLYAQNLVRALADFGFLVEHIAPAADNPGQENPHPRIKRVRPSRELAVAAPRFRRALASSRRLLGSIVALFSARLRQRDFIITIPDPLVFILPALLLLKLTGARIIYVVHDAVPHAWRLPNLLRGIEKFGFRIAYWCAAELVVLSPKAAEILRAIYGLRGKPIHFIEHGYQAPGPAPPLPGNRRLFVFGSLRRNKGIKEAIQGVIKARARGADVQLLIAGAPHRDDLSYWVECAALAKAHPEAIEVREGYVSNEALPGLIASVDAFLLPYRDFASQSGVAMEALGNGRALVACAEGGLALLVDEGAPVFVIAPVADGAAVADAILAFAATDVAQLEETCAAYRQRFYAKRSWPVVAAAFAALINARPGEALASHV
jgi:glycosyltransferase involved in cell wall biosynthesis